MTKQRVNNVEINYELKGDGDAIVFLHGFTGSTRDWDSQIDLISDKYRTIAVDHRGHGMSEAPVSEEEYSIQIFSQDVYALLKELGIDRCCLVGHSMGGFMSLQFVLDHPEMVSGLVLVDTSSGDWDMAPGYEEFRAKLVDLAENDGLEAVFEYDAANNPARIEKFEKHPELREIARQKVLNTSVEGYIHVGNSFQKWPSVTNRLGEIKVPTIVFLGEEDAGFVRSSQVMKDGIAGSKLVVVPGVGHNPHEEAPDLFNKDFLDFLPTISW
ncbi:MAG: alpha/beta fold hydrolase [Proteobacteria bacterium]|nr:alpha/beta fold hydrolase [Pseudomonadota bacterium]